MFNHSYHGVQIFFGVIAILFTVGYITAVLLSYRRQKNWKLHQMLFFIVGVILSTFALVGPVANLAHSNFTIHMIAHLLLGMLGPLLVAFGKPVTLLLRTLPVSYARRLIVFLRKRPLTSVTHPIVASLLNIGGLWVLYTTPLFDLMHMNPLLYSLIHIHVFLAGYVFTISMIEIEPLAHRFSFGYRAVVMVLSLAGHGILSKWIYAHPPVGVAARDAEVGAMIMYYGGDAVDLILVIVLCYQWYRAARPRGLSRGQPVKLDSNG
ncbi:cytochrome c oxidase assembly protein [Niallia sp. XMNu-256]|uniref:cytochrome c oxidase assembly protein n=1 Tax=Niallia sp. XMNu-256 TaxID=3082444 RepID=UPI0030CB9336